MSQAGSATSEGTITSFDGPGCPGGKPIELVFRTVGERTSDLALELAIRAIRPTKVHVIRNVRPFSRAVQRMLRLPHTSSHVVHVDADCLILEDMRPFLETNDLPYVDCYVNDRFRGRIHCGVHITSVQVLRAMREQPEPVDDLRYVLRPESRLRNLALTKLGLEKQLASFHILHDHFQRYTDIFHKYALRELRSRDDEHQKRLDHAMRKWGRSTDVDVARRAVAHARTHVPRDASPAEIDAYIRELPEIAEAEVRAMGLVQAGTLTMDEVNRAMEADPVGLGPPTTRKPKVFGLGLSRTGTRSLTAALHLLGWDTIHYPTDRATLETLMRGDVRFPHLDRYDGITDITVSPYYEDLDRTYPGSKFVLTVRDEESWLRSCANHWSGRPAYQEGEGEDHAIHMEIRRFLRAAVYASDDFEPERFRRAYRRHVENVTRYFADRPGDLLVLAITQGEGFEKLAPFLGVPAPSVPFPHKGKKLSERMSKARADAAPDPPITSGAKADDT
ncbi:MAG: hypothetical protein OHK0013_22320 [Sandaracinaceae bacterium]